MEIVEALQLLDTQSDEHWTEDGLPELTVVAELVGEEVTRAQVTDAQPDFSRNTAEVASAAPDQKDEDEVPVEGTSEMDRLEAHVGKLNDELAEVAQELAVLNGKRANLENQIHQTSGRIDQIRPIDYGQANITKYLARQKELGREKAARRQELMASGIGEVLKSVRKAPIDEALNRRKPERGSQRPLVRPESAIPQ